MLQSCITDGTEDVSVFITILFPVNISHPQTQLTIYPDCNTNSSSWNFAKCDHLSACRNPHVLPDGFQDESSETGPVWHQVVSFNVQLLSAPTTCGRATPPDLLAAGWRRSA